MKKLRFQGQKRRLAFLLHVLLFLSIPGVPVAGAAILVKGVPARGVHSGSDGAFRINAIAGETLVIRYMGFETVEIPASSGQLSDIINIHTTRSDQY